MKKILLLLAFTIAIVSCKKEVSTNSIVISGTVTNANSEKLTLYNQYNFSNKKEITLTESGSFTSTVNVDNIGFFTLYDDKNAVPLFLNNGDNVTVNFDAKKIDSTLVISGNGSEINNYLFEKSKIKTNTKQLYSKTEDEFLKDLAARKQQQKELLANTNVSKEFSEIETKNINYDYLSFLNNYKRYHSYFTKKENFTTSEGFLDALKNVDFANENDFKLSSSYRAILGNHYREKSEELVKKDSLKNDIAYLTSLAAIKSKIIKNKMLFDDAQYGITYTNNLEDYYKIYSEASTNEKNNEKITKIYNDLKVISKGNPSPKFMDYENNAGGTNSLDDYKGKFVYIDVWATWCGPCIAEIPSLKKVEKQYHGKNIAFLSISIDDKKDHEKWKKMIVEKDLKGVQLFADNNWNSKFVQDYQIKGIPRFILIDPQGNIVTANAPRPSDSKLVDLFNANKI